MRFRLLEVGFDRDSASDYSPARSAWPKDRPAKLRAILSRGRPIHQGKDGRVNLSPHVLVIDRASDTETVLKAVLEPRGATVERSRSSLASSRFDASSAPKVVVIDVDAAPEAIPSASSWSGTPRVILGSHKPSATADRERFLEKPFHFPELVRVIEELLAEFPAA